MRNLYTGELSDFLLNFDISLYEKTIKENNLREIVKKFSEIFSYFQSKLLMIVQTNNKEIGIPIDGQQSYFLIVYQCNYKGKLLLIIAGNDLLSKEFDSYDEMDSYIQCMKENKNDFAF